MRMSKPSGIAEMVVPVIVTAGMSGRIDRHHFNINPIDDRGRNINELRIRIDSLNGNRIPGGWARSQGHTDRPTIGSRWVVEVGP